MYFLFDFDGTIADTLSLTKLIREELQEKYHLSAPSDADVASFKNLPAHEVFKKLGLSAIQIPFFLNDLRKITTREIETIEMFTGLKEVLVTLKTKGHHLAIVTSNSQENVELFLAHHAIKDLFEFIHSELNIWGKAAALKNVLKTKKINPDETYYVGDEIRDIVAAGEAGLKIISVGWGFNSTTALLDYTPDFLINKPQELLQYGY